jgi:hypothetical protein
MSSRTGNGEKDYRGFVGPSDKYDLISATQFNLLTFLDLREDHYFLDIGCGSLRAGKLFIPFLLPGRYHGIEPEQWLIDEGIRNELGKDIIEVKKPVFMNDDNFTLSAFGKKFDYILAHSFAKGNDDYSGDEWVYPGFVKYTEAHMRTLFEEQGLSSTILNWPHPEFQVWIVAALNENHEGTEHLEFYRLEDLESKVKKHQEALIMDREALFDLYFQRDGRS